MKPADITKIIEDELKDSVGISNPHHIDLKKCLVIPAKQVFKDSFNKNKDVSFWLVLEESPDTKDGYKIIYDEETKYFGLVTANNIFIGMYGSFGDTLNAM